MVSNKSTSVFWFKSKVYIAIILLLVILTIGVVGFMVLSNYTFVEALYMTVITVTTVGFGEVHPLDDQARLFTIFLIVVSIGVYLFAVSIFTEYIANGELFKKLNTKKLENKIKALRNHVIIIGYGRNGKQAALKLHKANRAFLVIENNPKAIKDLIAEDKLHIYGDATEDEILDKASIAHAHSLILALPSDADNLFIAISARQQNPNLLIISRVSHESSYKKLKTVGVDNVIMPDKIGGEHMASLVLTPDLIEFVDRIALDGECETNLQEIIIEDKLKEFENKSLIDLDIRKKTGCSIIGIKKPNGQYVVNPDPETKLELKTKIILLGRPDQIEKLKSYF